ncbi:Lrp/AsnC family transcriptional regulator [Agromyces seonyuensis]|uniref:AsnC family transcriptional regulator n=1 Tax=Agromyces seonyuensis TaxID=2662446 RepID=A0A6I4P110_9MICO|nr:Lrp/AsnC family transcriptional regulator [Agromyces seonyuensis]MWB98415.1 AsnC family transcriptional regulator [Agromyces seonyuensis]
MTEHVGARAAHPPLDRIDRRIVAELSRDGRLSVRTIAERVHISRTAAHNRLQQLVRRGVLTGFGAQVDRAALGLEVAAIVIVHVAEDADPQGIAKTLADLPFVERAQLTAGEPDIILTVSAPDQELLSIAILRDLHDVPGVAGVRSRLLVREFDGDGPAAALDHWEL